MQAQDTEVRRVETFFTPKRTGRMALLVGLGIVGAFIKIPSPVGTVGLDSAPGYFAAIAFGGLEGALVAFISTFFGGWVVGFPVGIPLWIVVCASMSLWAVCFRWVNNRFGLIPAIIVGTLLNGVVGAAIDIPVGGMALFYTLLPILTVASFINLTIAGVAYKVAKRSKYI